MDRAVMLAPDKIGVLVPRAAALLPYAAHLPDPVAARRLNEKAIGDLEKVVAMSQAAWPQLSVHARGELMGGLADGLLRIGETERANALLERMMGELPDSAYARQAQKRLANPAGREPLTCLGCH
jgi:thioredoxin-like negative regulator of GroEL